MADDNTSFCGRCGTQSRAGAKFCPSCGAPALGAGQTVVPGAAKTLPEPDQTILRQQLPPLAQPVAPSPSQPGGAPPQRGGNAGLIVGVVALIAVIAGAVVFAVVNLTEDPEPPTSTIAPPPTSAPPPLTQRTTVRPPPPPVGLDMTSSGPYRDGDPVTFDVSLEDPTAASAVTSVELFHVLADGSGSSGASVVNEYGFVESLSTTIDLGNAETVDCTYEVVVTFDDGTTRSDEQSVTVEPKELGNPEIVPPEVVDAVIALNNAIRDNDPYAIDHYRIKNVEELRDGYPWSASWLVPIRASDDGWVMGLVTNEFWTQASVDRATRTGGVLGDRTGVFCFEYTVNGLEVDNKLLGELSEAYTNGEHLSPNDTYPGDSRSIEEYLLDTC